jgi:hypothetical protein
VVKDPTSVLMTVPDVVACSRVGEIAKLSRIKIPVAIKFTLSGHNFEMEAQIQNIHKPLNALHKLYLKRLIKSLSHSPFCVFSLFDMNLFLNC